MACGGRFVTGDFADDWDTEDRQIPIDHTYDEPDDDDDWDDDNHWDDEEDDLWGI